MKTEECGSTYSVRIPDAPADQWETATCIQRHDDAPWLPGTIHRAGDGTRWAEVDHRADDLAVLELRDSRDSLQMLRETLCEAQITLGLIDSWPDEEARIAEVIPHRERIERLIAEIDRQRPLGPDGEHGDLHTPTCGCDR